MILGERPTSPDSDPNHNEEDGHHEENGQVNFSILLSKSNAKKSFCGSTMQV